MTTIDRYKAEFRFRLGNAILGASIAISCLTVAILNIRIDLVLTAIFLAAYIVAARITYNQARMAVAYKMRANRTELRQSLHEANLRWKNKNK